MKPIQVLIADDHTLIREGLRQLLDLQVDIKVVAEACDGVEALEKARICQPDVLLLDIAMPRMTGLEAVRVIRNAVPKTRIVILSMYEKEAYAQQVLSAGAHGYVLKGDPSKDLLAAIRAAHEGKYYFSHQIHADLIQGYLSQPREKTPATGYQCLSEREQQVFKLMIEANSTSEIADILSVSHKTVEKHRANLTRKLGISNPIELMKYAIRIGIVDPDSWKN